MRSKNILSTIRTINSRLVPGGGYSEEAGSPPRVDSTAWAILALKALGMGSDIQESEAILVTMQHDDGRFCLSPEHPYTIWPTALAVLALKGSVTYRKQSERAVQFLLQMKGTSFNKETNPIFAIDPSLLGWPWIEGSFSWVEPTALAVMALTSNGRGLHDRVRQAIRLLMDRQLPSGGWNIGSTVIYGRETYPQIDCTGLALCALAGQIKRKEIERSLDYLKTQAQTCRTPLSLGWALLGLGAWDNRPAAARRWTAECLARQNKYGSYGTSLLSLVLLAHKAEGGFYTAVG